MKNFSKLVSLIAILFLIISFSCKPSCTKKIKPTGIKDVEVTFKSPQGAVYQPQSIVASFSAPMVAINTIGELEKIGPIKLSPSVSGTFHWLGTQTVSFVPDKPLPFATKFSVKIDDSTLNLKGDGLKEAISWEFETARPAVINTVPINKATGVNIKDNIFLYFNQPMDPGTVSDHIKITATGPDDNNSDIKFDARRPTEEEIKNIGGDVSRGVIIHPTNNLPVGSQITVLLDDKVTGTEGDLTPESTYSMDFLTYGPLKVVNLECSEKCDPGQPVTLILSNAAVPKDNIKFIKFTPDVSISNDGDWESTYFQVYGKLKPNTKYVITISPDFTDNFGNKLGKEEKISFSTADYGSRIGFVSGYGVVESGGPKEIAVSTMNVQNLTLKYKTLGKEDIVPIGAGGLFDETGVFNETNIPTAEENIKVAGEPNKLNTIPIPLSKELGEKATGLILMDLSSPQVKSPYAEGQPILHYSSILQITDIGITGKFSDSDQLIWTTSLSKGTPIEGVNIQLRDTNNNILWTGITGSNGTAKSKIKKSDGEDEGFDTIYVIAEKDGDIAFSSSDWTQGFNPWDFGLMEDYNSGSFKSFLFTERGVYKPGETIHLKAITRKLTSNGLVTPKNLTGRVLATNSRGQQFFSQDVEFSPQGTTNTDIKIPPYLPTGVINIELEALSGETKEKASNSITALIAEYKPAEFKLDLTPSKKRYSAGEDLSIKVSANYLFGEPMKQSDLTWSVYKERSYFSPKDYEEYTFGKFELEMFDEERNDEGSLEIKGTANKKLDDKGLADINIPIKSGSVNNTTDYVVETTVTDINKQSISNRTAVTVDPGEFYIGLKSSAFFVNIGTPFDINVISVASNGELISGKKIATKLFKREWQTVKKKEVIGYTYESKPVDTEVANCSTTTDKTTSKCSLTAKAGGTYVIKATATDSKGNLIESNMFLYSIGAGEAGWEPDSTDRIELVADKKEYAPGESAKVLIKSPFDTCNALVTYERSGIIHQETAVLSGNTPTLNVPITDKHIPNFFVSVVLLKGRMSDKLSETGEDIGRPRIKVGYLNIPVTATSKILKTVVETNKKEASPGDEIETTIKVTDSQGKPVKSEVTVMAVDTGSLILTNYKTPDPFDEFYAEVPLGVSTSDSRINLIGLRHYGVKGEPAGGGGAEGDNSPFRNKFLPVAYWNPNVETDENGTAKVSFKLPDNLTTFKIMAVASANDMFGNGDTEVISKKPFMLRVAIPYFVSVGDEIQASVIVHNYSDSSVSGKLTATAEGIELSSGATESFSVSSKGKEEIFFKLKATKLGRATLSFKAETEAGSDGIQVPLEIKLTRPKEVFTSFGETTTSVTETLSPLQNVYPDLGGLDIGLSSTALTGLMDPMLYLLQYPYECLEQKISRTWGMIIYSKIVDEFKLDDESVKAYPEKIKQTIFEFNKFQDYNGGFKLWPELNPNPYITIYAVQFLNTAKGFGYEIDDTSFNKAKDYIKELLRWKAKDKHYTDEYLNSLKAYALYVLSIIGEPETQYYEKIYQGKDTLPLSSLAQLMIAMKKDAGIPTQFDDFLQYIDNHLMITPSGAHFEDNDPKTNSELFRSNEYTDAYVLLSMLKLKPTSPNIAKLARYLLTNSKNGRWTSTHTTAAVLSALYDYIMMGEKDVPNFTASVKLGQQELASTKFEGRDVKETSLKLSIAQLIALTAPTELQFGVEGTGKLYYRTRLTYSSTEDPLPPREEGFTIFKELLPFDKNTRSTTFKRGDIVRVRLEFVLPAERRNVVINDGLPAGLEAVNFSLATAQRHLTVNENKNYRFNHVEIYGDRVLIFADRLPAGAYKFEYIAKASTKGEFTVPVAQIEEMYNPEVFGRTSTGKLEIK